MKMEMKMKASNTISTTSFLEVTNIRGNSTGHSWNSRGTINNTLSSLPEI